MMNENSPICPSDSAVCTAVGIPYPATKAPTVTPTSRPTTTTAEKSSTVPAWVQITCGSISIPTETKKIAAKRSRTGSSRCSMILASPDSATSAPPRKAPNATE